MKSVSAHRRVSSHYSSSLSANYPIYGFRMKYIKDTYQDRIVFDPNHQIGQLVDQIDLRYWGRCREAIASALSEGVVTRHLDVSNNEEIDEEFPTFLLSMGLEKVIQVFNLHGCDMLGMKGLIHIGCFEQLRTLDVSRIASVNDEIIGEFSRNLHALSALDISHCKNLTNLALEYIAEHVGMRLLELKAAANQHYNHMGLYQVVLKGEKLHTLDISNCTNISFLGIVVKTVGAAVTKQFASRAIRNLKLDGCVNLQELSLTWVSLALPALERVSLKNLPNLLDPHIQGMVLGCRGLKEITVTGCPHVTNNSWKFIGEQLPENPQLELLVMQGVGINLSGDGGQAPGASAGWLTSETLRKLLRASPSLKKLDVATNPNLTDELFTMLDLAPAAEPAPVGEEYRLRRVIKNAGKNGKGQKGEKGASSRGSVTAGSMKSSVTGAGTVGSKGITATVTEEGLSKFGYKKAEAQGPPPPARGAEALKILNIANCGLTSYGLACCAKIYRCLEELNISGITKIQDAALKVVVGCCPRLRVLKASDCTGLTDEGVSFLCKHSRYLHTLHLSFAKVLTDALPETYEQYTDKTVRAILESAVALREVALCNQQAVKFASSWLRKTFAVRKGNFSIQSLDLRGCGNISSAHLAAIFRCCYMLNDVKLPAKFFGTEVASKAFWRRAFSSKHYVCRFSQAEVDSQREAAAQLMAPAIVTKKSGFKSTKKEKTKPLSKLEGFHVLQPHPLKNALEFRDMMVRRRVLEIYSARLIQQRFRLHRIWSKFRYRVMARRLAYTYKAVLEFRKLMAKAEVFRRNHAAKVIQHHYYLYAIVYLNAAKRIQRGYRRYQRGKDLYRHVEITKKVTNIQRIVRGMLVRISDRYLLTKIYMQLPPFWREVLKIDASRAPARRSDQRKIHQYEVAELHAQTKSMTKHILENVVANRKLPPKLPLVVPQPFDKRPYVSLSDGRQMGFFSDHPSLFTSEFLNKTKNSKNFELSTNSLKYLVGSTVSADERQQMIARASMTAKDSHKLPMHIFNQKFWPLTQAPHVEDPSTLEHDPWLNSFEVIQNKTTPLTCQVCCTRLRIIQCQTCVKGFCFFCAFRTHTRAFKRNHHMEMIEPRVVQYKEVTQSLVYHIDMAHAVTHDLAYLVKYLRSAAEMQRIQHERKMLKEYERQEEKKRLAYLKAREESKDKHNAASKIAMLYRMAKARRIVGDRRLQVHLEQYVRKARRVDVSVVMVQRLFRMYSVRRWMHSQGYLFRNSRYADNRKAVSAISKNRTKAAKWKQELARKGRGSLDPKAREKMLQRTTFSRTHMSRQQLIAQVEAERAAVMQLLQSNITYWLKEFKRIEPQVQQLFDLRAKLHDEHKEAQRKAARDNLTATPVERDKCEVEIKNLHQKYEAAEARLDNVRNMLWWITQHLRSSYRKKKIVRARFADTLARVEWVSHEATILNRLEMHMEERVKLLKATVDMEVPASWVERYLGFVRKQTIVLDSVQEAILTEELGRLEQDARKTQMFDSLIGELLSSLRADNQYTAERIYLDCELKREKYGSERGIRINEQLIELKAKQKQLANTSIDTLKVGLQQKYDEEDDENLQNYGFPSDDPDLPVDEMHKIEAVIIEPFVPTNHCKISDFLQVYLVQPWLAEQAVEDVRLEEMITSLQLQSGELKEELQSIKSALHSNDLTLRSKEKKYAELQNEIELKTDPLQGESVEEGVEREAELVELRKQVPAYEEYFAAFPGIKADLERRMPPLLEGIEGIKVNIENIQQKLRDRIKVRERSSDAFFKVERDLCVSLAERARLELIDTEADADRLRKQVSLCQSFSSSDQVIQDLLDDLNIGLEERALINVPRNDARYKLQQLMHEFRPRTTASAISAVRETVRTHKLVCQANERHHQRYQQLLEREVDDLETFASKNKEFNASLVAFRNSLLNDRRQRAIQLDLEQRAQRLQRLRNVRLKAMGIAKAAQEEKEREEAEAEAKRLRDYKSTTKQIADAAKKTIRVTKDAIRDYRYRAQIAMDDEEKRLAQNIRERNKDGVFRPEGIQAFHITVGQEEAQVFQRQNDHLKSKGLPHFIRMERSIGNQTYIWSQSTFDSSQFITNLMLAHKEPGDENYMNLYKQKYFMVQHEKCNMVMWLKNDRKRSRGIKRLEVTFTEAEEARLTADGCEKIDTNLALFQLPETYIWMERVEKIKRTVKVSKYDLIAELTKVKKVLANNPNDKNLQALVARLEDKLAQELEKERQKKKVDPITFATEMLALEESDLVKLKKVFNKIDYNRQSKVTMSQLFEFFEETPTPTNRAVFTTFDAVDSEGFVKYEPFVKTVSQFCLFGTREVLRLLFSHVDVDREGFMPADKFAALVNSMHPYDRKKTNRALKLMQFPPTHQIHFDEFSRINGEYPQLFHPIFALQHSMRSKVLGIDWWFNKMTKYKGVREKLAKEGTNTEELVEMEMNRFQADEARERRMAERELAIKQETSEVRKTLLKARQFMDEFS